MTSFVEMSYGQVVEGGIFTGEDVSDGVVEGGGRDCQFRECVFDGARLVGVEFLNCSFISCSFQEVRFEKCVFLDGLSQMGCVWKYCDVSEACFQECNLGMNKFMAGRGYLVEFRDCAAAGIEVQLDVHKSISKQMLMGGMAWTGCKMQYAAFAEGNYATSRFEQCDLRDCGFSGCDLSGVSFRESQLENIDVTRSVLDGADLAGAGFELLDVRGMASYRGMMVSRGQHEALLTGLGIVTLESSD